MKTTHRSFLLGLLAFCLSSGAKAQCPDLKNDLSCPITIVFFQYNGTTQCAAPNVINVLPGTTISLPCTCGNNYAVRLVNVGGAAVAPITAQTLPATPFPGPSTAVLANCSFSGSANLYFDNSLPNYQFEVNQ